MNLNVDYMNLNDIEIVAENISISENSSQNLVYN